MVNLPVVAIYGNSDSGKTELVVRLLEDLIDEGLEVCTVKHSPGEYSLNEEGKDTWRHREAGANLTVFSTKMETTIIIPEERELEEIVGLLSNFSEYDLVIAEGYKDEDVPKVSVGEIEKRKSTVYEYDGDMAALKDRVRTEIELKEIENELPGLDCGRCGYDSCRGLARAIHDGEEELEDCEVREERSVVLEVNGEDVPLENFPADFVEGGLKGMLRALKGVDDEIDSISLEING
ncbi:molybdopterin-guanine dinucleotide biosynthesis protein B [Candidatus Bipolaricaulota bacterium]|nr:molybdopterin-guanine dinucleotide biosynthesis protein B [Candidatus Bipolaricaulota bacterium]